jgi:hypothetical protein
MNEWDIMSSGIRNLLEYLNGRIVIPRVYEDFDRLSRLRYMSIESGKEIPQKEALEILAFQFLDIYGEPINNL